MRPDFLHFLSSLLSPQPTMKQHLGYQVRGALHPGEADFYRQNPSVSGMAADDGMITLNPHSEGVNKNAVVMNEAFRLFMRSKGITPEFDLTPDQQQRFAGTAYGSNPDALKQSIAARVYSGDPSAQATPEQVEFVRKLKELLGGGTKP